MYDYRNSIQKILNHTTSTNDSLATGAYAIRTICDIVLQTQEALPTENQAASTANPAAQNETVTKAKPSQTLIYSKPFIEKFQQIVKANPNLTLHDIAKATNVSRMRIQKLITAKDAFYVSNKNSFNVHTAIETREKILKALDIDPQIMLDDNISSLNPIYAKEAFIEYKPNHNFDERPAKAKIKIKLQLKYISFGALLRDVRNQLHENQTDFGQRFKLSASKISEMENDKIKPTIDLIKDLSQLTKQPISELNSRVESSASVQKPKPGSLITNSAPVADPKPSFLMYQGTSNKDLLAHALTEPLGLNQYLARRDFNRLQLLSNRGDVVYETNVINPQNENIETGDIVAANITNRHQAYILKVTNRHLNFDQYITITNAKPIRRYNEWVTYGSTTEQLNDVNRYHSYYTIPEKFAKSVKIDADTRLNITWRKQEPKCIFVTKVTHNASKTNNN